MDLSRDTAIVNIPLSKRGNIDAQIDKYKADQRKLQQEKREVINKDKKIAKELFGIHKAAMKAKYGKNLAVVEDWAKWQPEKAIKFINMFLEGK